MTLDELDEKMKESGMTGYTIRYTDVDRYVHGIPNRYIAVYDHPKTQERLLVEVIDGRPTVYSFCRNLEPR